MLTKENAKAYAILAILVDMLDEDDDLRVEPYLNGRENGFAVKLRSGNEKVVFSQHRRSDDIVVYSDKYHRFSMQGNSPTDEIYYNRQTFSPNDYYRAAEFVVQRLRK